MFSAILKAPDAGEDVQDPSPGPAIRYPSWKGNPVSRLPQTGRPSPLLSAVTAAMIATLLTQTPGSAGADGSAAGPDVPRVTTPLMTRAPAIDGLIDRPRPTDASSPAPCPIRPATCGPCSRTIRWS